MARSRTPRVRACRVAARPIWRVLGTCWHLTWQAVGWMLYAQPFGNSPCPRLVEGSNRAISRLALVVWLQLLKARKDFRPRSHLLLFPPLSPRSRAALATARYLPLVEATRKEAPLPRLPLTRCRSPVSFAPLFCLSTVPFATTARSRTPSACCGCTAPRQP